MSPSAQPSPLTSLKLPSLSKVEQQTIKTLQREWTQRSQRMRSLRPEHAHHDQKTALAEFLAHPTEENEQRLAVLADERLTARRYAMLLAANAELRWRINEQAAHLMRPVLTARQTTLTGELQAQQQAAQVEGRHPRNDERSIELRHALAQVDQAIKLQDAVLVRDANAEDWSPQDLAALLLGEPTAPAAA